MSTILCAFAHPDDETFGPGGTIAKYAKNNDVYLVCATRGEQGNNATDEKKIHLATIRENELLHSAQILGIKKVFFLDYIDGTLSNNLYHEIAEKLSAIIRKIKPHILLTFEPRGVSGHIDHMAMSMITTFVYKKVTDVQKLYYYCNNKKYTKPMEDYFIHFPEGYDEKDITTFIDIQTVWDIKVESMYAHHTQRLDAERVLARCIDKPKKEYFILAEHRLQNLSFPETDLLNGIK